MEVRCEVDDGGGYGSEVCEGVDGCGCGGGVARVGDGGGVARVGV